MARVIPAFSPEANLKRKVRDHLRTLGFSKDSSGHLVPPISSKESVRVLHRVQRRERILVQRDFIKDQFKTLRDHFAAGVDVDPNRVAPRLELIDAGTWQSDLFRLATLSWSVPVSAGFGRRLRYLVWDSHNAKLMGVIALGDPVFNLKARDDLVGWDSKDRAKRLVNIMDAYVLGALPPYNRLLGGKLVSCLIRTRDVRDDFAEKYADTRGIISKKRKKAQLVTVTTSSSLGRSSIYNRLKLDDQEYFTPIGFTGGWGHFHIPDSLFASLRNYLRDAEHKYVDGHKFGQGPNWRLRTIRAAFDALGFDADMLRHGIKREVFLCNLAVNAPKILRGESTRAIYRGLKSVEEVGVLARERWLSGRAERMPEYRDWKVEEFEKLLRSVPPSSGRAVSVLPTKR
ncbi:MAG TPA: Druantia anti-phage system protein DruA [Rhizomicrobium sp.]|nr:Druantia anti-phage system protein DruA [Rhizomicrobium sp.]